MRAASHNRSRPLPGWSLCASCTASLPSGGARRSRPFAQPPCAAAAAAETLVGTARLIEVGAEPRGLEFAPCITPPRPLSHRGLKPSTSSPDDSAPTTLYSARVDQGRGGAALASRANVLPACSRCASTAAVSHRLSGDHAHGGCLPADWPAGSLAFSPPLSRRHPPAARTAAARPVRLLQLDAVTAACRVVSDVRSQLRQRPAGWTSCWAPPSSACRRSTRCRWPWPRPPSR